MSNLSKGRKEALWAKLLGQEGAAAEGGEGEEGGGGSGGGGGDDSSSDSGDDDGLDECMRLFSSGEAGEGLPPLEGLKL
jgi:hypothetical protein